MPVGNRVDLEVLDAAGGSLIKLIDNVDLQSVKGFAESVPAFGHASRDIALLNDELTADPTRAADYEVRLPPARDTRTARQDVDDSEIEIEDVEHTGFRVLLVIDQFEQSLLANGEMANAQSTGSLTAAQDMTERAGALVTFGFRADRYPAALNNLQLQDMIHGQEVRITPMNTDELGEITDRPARACNVEPEEGFTDWCGRTWPPIARRAPITAASLPCRPTHYTRRGSISDFQR